MVSTTTGYRSPVRLVGHAGEPITPFSQQALSRSKKKLLAEIALNNDELEIDGVNYSRNDVVTSLEHANETNWPYHSIIYTQEGLLRFLEKNEFDAEAMKAASAYRYKTDFVQFVSPAFAYSFGEVSGRLLRGPDEFASMNALMDHASFILTEHSHEAYGKIRTYFDELLYTVKNLSWEKFQRDESVLHFIFMPNWIGFVNKLPSEYASYRDSIVEQMLGLVFNFQHKATWYYLKEVCLRLQGIDCSPNWKEEVAEYIQIMSRNSGVEARKEAAPVSSDSSDGPSAGRIIFWVIWAVFAIFRIARCNSNNNDRITPDYNFNRIGISQEDLKQKLRDNANEQNFKEFLSQLNRSEYEGKAYTQKKGETAIPGVTRVMPDRGTDSLAVTNNSGRDAILFCFDGDAPLVDSLSRVQAVYIREGASVSLRVPAGAVRVNFAFGRNWIKLDEPIALSLQAGPLSSASEDVGAWTFRHYFAQPDTFSRFLTHDITFRYYPESSEAGKRLIYQPETQDDGSEVKTKEGSTSRRIRIRLEEQNGVPVIRGGGSWSIYLNGPNFLPSQSVPHRGLPSEEVREGTIEEVKEEPIRIRS